MPGDTRMSHQELLESAAAYALGSLDVDERAAFEAHLPGCEACLSEVATYGEVVAQLALALPPVAPRDAAALRARLLAEARQVRPLPVARVPRRPVVRPAWLAAAACLAIAAVGGLAYRTERDAHTRVAAELAGAR